ncbi:MAG: chorismate-binding protein, partial [Streptosporangiaceae bacterium]
MRVLSHRERSGSGRLFVQTVAVPDPGDLLDRIPQPDVVAWVHHGAGLIGWGEAVRVTLPAGEDRFTAGEKWLRSVFDAADVDDKVRVRGSGPVAFGTFTFDASSDGSVLIVPRVVLGRDGRGQAWLTAVTEPGEAATGWPLPVIAEPAEPTGLSWRGGSLPGPRWEQAVAEAVAAIKAGGLRKVVLARDVFGTADEPIDARVLLRRLAGRYPDCFTFACDGMIGATPELLVSRNGHQVSALVLGGTLPRGANQAEDDALGAELLASAKNHEEHAYA